MQGECFRVQIKPLFLLDPFSLREESGEALKWKPTRNIWLFGQFAGVDAQRYSCRTDEDVTMCEYRNLDWPQDLFWTCFVSVMSVEVNLIWSFLTKVFGFTPPYASLLLLGLQTGSEKFDFGAEPSVSLLLCF